MFKIVRNDITKMNTDAIVNTANSQIWVGTGCDSAVYKAAGYEELMQYRKEKIGFVPEGDVFLTPGFHLQAKYIIHAVSPRYKGGGLDEEEKLRSCYRKSLRIAEENNIKSIAFPLISTGGFGYPKEEGLRIAIDEINTFLPGNEMLIYLVVFDTQATMLGEKLYPDLEAYIDYNYVKDKREEEYGPLSFAFLRPDDAEKGNYKSNVESEPSAHTLQKVSGPSSTDSIFKKKEESKAIIQGKDSKKNSVGGYDEAFFPILKSGIRIS